MRTLRCSTHDRYHWSQAGCPTERVLADVLAHRGEQFAEYGDNADLEDGTGKDVRWLATMPSFSTRSTAELIEVRLREEYGTHGVPTWMHLVREEVAEAFMESDPVRLREELVQVAALCVSWVEQLDAR